ncbi:TPA: nucleotide exchange factor GrpE [Patescibacteria group bacterium]|uniref:Protein GrpE n=1 Tax=Candidatus Gottesmanbacteria bacterium GW2011_GWA1_43_11 TaxID=1618436 RepID=A0A0G1EN24_9BACT|nr:MAG: Protein GrpE [Candidatus Gottesmanbacteria bacterium GW2011_GWA1_43_11]HCS79444.1 nucleotide exchange factor GrpE [Patescibacteria group bacterium]
MNQDDQNKTPKAKKETGLDESHLKALEEKVSEYELRWKRALADYQNLEKRTEERFSDLTQFAVKRFIEKLLPVIDDLEKAREHIKDEGLNLAWKKLMGVLKENGIEHIPAQGKTFDIHTMEAIHMVEGKADNQVVAEHRAGYLMHGSVLRPAQVTVSKKKS